MLCVLIMMKMFMYDFDTVYWLFVWSLWVSGIYYYLRPAAFCNIDISRLNICLGPCLVLCIRATCSLLFSLLAFYSDGEVNKRGICPL
ncbi:hypothetical protein F5X96DRAFT_663310 [Biscogniauxia mediterranea]|nr:hypothetical protein F5X96DRAFT_663310 [Biscogniauxia mediterranea]